MKVEHVAVNVRDMERAIAFYTEKLGFSILYRFGDDQNHMRTVYIQRDSVKLELIEGAAEEEMNAADGKCGHICMEGDDMNSFISLLQQEDIPIIDGPNEIPGLERWLFFSDPDGNVFEYVVWESKCVI